MKDLEGREARTVATETEATVEEEDMAEGAVSELEGEASGEASGVEAIISNGGEAIQVWVPVLAMASGKHGVHLEGRL